MTSRQASGRHAMSTIVVTTESAWAAETILAEFRRLPKPVGRIPCAHSRRGHISGARIFRSGPVGVDAQVFAALTGWEGAFGRSSAPSSSGWSRVPASRSGCQPHLRAIDPQADRSASGCCTRLPRGRCAGRSTASVTRDGTGRPPRDVSSGRRPNAAPDPACPRPPSRRCHRRRRRRCP